ncbi:response regulator [Methylorubrum thiocyanatum]|uniref:DNA-binding response OmpR family regulator n=1 Tax=Methylorubrum thiocyanatum TaxID=47958 RepID=A0AA40VCZ8_9HYPH|nr:response regulator [Methylorubrum thiocyanatum]MBA8914086.1 DNA-binding response OmpR family regulator [Methylorubrum thiocyanatum]GJE79051.1 Transcriptional regulatory protein QseB [Methylorubrum thiocyanatum]
MRILVVEDDTILSDGLRAGLGLGGATVDCVATRADAEAALATSAFSAIVLDLMLPDGSGLDVLRGLRRRNDRTPVVLLTARDAVADRIAGLDGGADDYLGKPFDLDELSARIRAVVRRASGRAAAILEHGAIRLDPGSLAVTVDGVPVAVSRREVMVLAALMERPDVLRSKAELEERLYGWQEEVESNAVEVHVHNLRAKIGKHAIETVRGLGYRMRAPA